MVCKSPRVRKVQLDTRRLRKEHCIQHRQHKTDQHQKASEASRKQELRV